MRASGSTNNNTDGDDNNQIIDQHASLENIAIATLATADNAENFNLTFADSLPLGAAISISNKFLISDFTMIVNTIVEKKLNVCEWI